MIIYDFHKDITLEQLNILASEGWEVVFLKDTDPNKIDAWLKIGYPDFIQPTSEYTLIENTETEAEFYLNKSFSYGDAIIITFFTMFFLAFLGKIIFNHLFHNE